MTKFIVKKIIMFSQEESTSMFTGDQNVQESGVFTRRNKAMVYVTMAIIGAIAFSGIVGYSIGYAASPSTDSRFKNAMLLKVKVGSSKQKRLEEIISGSVPNSTVQVKKLEKIDGLENTHVNFQEISEVTKKTNTPVAANEVTESTDKQDVLGAAVTSSSALVNLRLRRRRRSNRGTKYNNIGGMRATWQNILMIVLACLAVLGLLLWCLCCPPACCKRNRSGYDESRSRSSSYSSSRSD